MCFFSKHNLHDGCLLILNSKLIQSFQSKSIESLLNSMFDGTRTSPNGSGSGEFKESEKISVKSVCWINSDQDEEQSH